MGMREWGPGVVDAASWGERWGEGLSRGAMSAQEWVVTISSRSTHHMGFAAIAE
ncbi:hypothetical protein M413DRAFT_445698 [Hebeloma cylindrosporum]|uniref:Uncharacterized protein n=1 Tax=Hebeloma cylindrosporum TaxID=76867 RepID=A0A0C2YIL5_HEBCY|nr:hypothetical protein M413DRAFT_445698 [Hebeloma cylindrosporum h7]